jgi:hypothetical protein
MDRLSSVSKQDHWWHGEVTMRVGFIWLQNLMLTSCLLACGCSSQSSGGNQGVLDEPPSVETDVGTGAPKGSIGGVPVPAAEDRMKNMIPPGSQVPGTSP